MLHALRGSRFKWAAVLLVLSAAILVALIGARQAGAIGSNAMRAGFETNTMVRNDDGSTGTVPLGFPINFFGRSYDRTYVNNNGNVTFDTQLSTYTPFNIVTARRVIIAPFFADVDTRASGQPVRYGQGTVGGRPAFGVTWRDVDCYAASTNRTVRNHFQLVLVDRSDVGSGDFDIEFNYDQIQWEAGQASGSDFNCQRGFTARAGYSNGSTAAFELAGSGVQGAFLDSNPITGLIHNSLNSLQPGRYVFSVRNGVAPTGGTITGTVSVNPPVANAFVQVCNTSNSCNLTSSNANGQYTVGGLPAGNYTVTAFPPAGANYQPVSEGPVAIAGSETKVVNLQFTGPAGPPAGTSITSVGTTGGGIPIIYWGQDLNLVTTGCPGGVASYKVVQNGAIIRSGPMMEGPAGTYTAVIPAFYPLHGDAEVVITIDCPDPTPDETIGFDIYIDPSGHVRDTNSNPIAGATVTLFRSDSSAGPFTVVPDGSAVMAPANRSNPDLTDADGLFRWDVITGFYRVRAEATNCFAPGNPALGYVETAVLPVPPPALDLLLVLECPSANAAPSADADGPYTVNEGGSVQLDGSGSSDPDSDPLTYVWDLDNDGQFDDATGANPTFDASALDGPDSRTVGLRVCDPDNACDTATTTITVNNVAPSINVTSPATATSGASFDVTVAFSDPGASDTHDISFNWGDGVDTVSGGTSSTTASHSYLTPGVHTVTVSVTDDDGASTSQAVTITVVRLEIASDVKPGSDANPLNLNGNGVVPVAVLTTGDFDAASIDIATVTFGLTGSEAVAVTGGHLEDVDGDGDLDLVLHFREGDLGIDPATAGNTIVGVALHAQTASGVYVEGLGNVRITPNNPNSRGKGGNGPK